MADDDRERGAGPGISATTLPDRAGGPRRRSPASPPTAEDAPADGDALALLTEVARRNYDVGDEVARGGLGRILEAYDRRLARSVAIKELLYSDDDAESRFAREVFITARLQHPNIVPIHEGGRWDDGKPFFAMKYVRGEPLRDAIESATSFTQRARLVSNVLDVADAMAYAHSQGIIHRDLKPANILLGPFGETVVIDWGLAKDLRATADGDASGEQQDDADRATQRRRTTADYDTRVGAVVGTPAYMPPEQARGEPVDERADVYALGAILYQVLAGQRPYATVSPMGLVNRVIAGPPEPLGELVPEAPTDLVAIIEKAMARRPAHRYRTAAQMADELRKFETGQLVGAHSYSSWELMSRFVRRQRAAMAVGAIALAALAAFGALAFGRISTERDAAERSARQARAARLTAEAERDRSEQRSDELRLARARSLLDDDPTEAALVLTQIGRPLAGAASVAADAQDRGVARWVLEGRGGALRDVAMSPDGAMVAAGGDDGRVELWTLDDRKRRDLGTARDRIAAIDFSPRGDALAAGAYDGSVRVWSLAGAAPVERVLASAGAQVQAVRFSPGGDRLATLDAEGLVAVWDLASGERRARQATPGRERVLAFSSDGRWLASASYDGAILVWNVSADSAYYLRGHADAVTWLGFSPGSHVLVSASRDGTARHWPPGEPARVLLPAGGPPLTGGALSPDGSRLAVGDADGTVQLVDLRPGAMAPAVLGAHDERVRELAFSPDGRRVLSVGWDKTARLWSLTGGDPKVLRGHDGVVVALAQSRDGDRVATASWDGSVRVWRPDAVPEPRRLTGHSVGVKALAFSPDGATLASGAHDRSVRLWRVADGAGSIARILLGHEDIVYRVAFSPDGRLLASSSDDRTVRLWRVADGAVRVLRGHSADVEELAFAPDGRWLLSGAEDNTARLWSTDSDTTRVLGGADAPITDVAFDAAGRAIAASRDGVVRAWNADGGEPTALARHDGPVGAVAATGSGLLSVGADDRLRRWDPDTGAATVIARDLVGATHLAAAGDGAVVAVGGERGALWLCRVVERRCRRLVGHEGDVEALAFSPDGLQLATASADNTARLWDLETGESRVLRGHSAPVFDVAFDPTGTLLATAGADAEIRLWTNRPPPSATVLPVWLDSLVSWIAQVPERPGAASGPAPATETAGAVPPAPAPPGN